MNNMASSSDSCSCSQILKNKWMFSTQTEHPQDKELTDLAMYQQGVYPCNTSQQAFVFFAIKD